ncbi:MAG: O-antigen ligase family protein, partial [Pusillimonas sp.]|nr:O-antigen ligase family protein [Pusillimonas sp.]
MLPTLLAFLIALAPILHISSHNLPSGLFYLILLVSLVLLARQRFANAGNIIHTYWPVMAAFSVSLLAVINATLHYGQWPGSNGEGALRLLLGVSLLLLACCYVPPQRLRWIAWGFVVACTLAFAIVLWLTLPNFVRPETPGNIPVAYSAFMALFMAIAFFSIGWKLTPWPKTERVIKVVAGTLGFAALVLTQARTGWLGVPLFILIGMVLFFNARNRNRAILAAVIATLIAAGAFLSSDVLRHKAVLAYTEAVECTGENSTQDTSICIRFQMWRAALDMAQQDPWTGIGDGGLFHDRMKTDSHPKGL